jgi:hypothetical protein
MKVSYPKGRGQRFRIQARLINLGVNIIPSRNLKAFDGSEVALECVYTGSEEEMQVDGLVLITARIPNDELYNELASQADPGDVPFKRESKEIREHLKCLYSCRNRSGLESREGIGINGNNVQHVILMVAVEQTEYYRRMNLQLIVDKQSKQQQNLSDT